MTTQYRNARTGALVSEADVAELVLVHGQTIEVVEYEPPEMPEGVAEGLANGSVEWAAHADEDSGVAVYV